MRRAPGLGTRMRLPWRCTRRWIQRPTFDILNTCRQGQDFREETGAHFYAQAHISTQSASSLESAWLPFTHEDQVRRGRAEPASRSGPQACLSERRIPRLSFPAAIVFGWNSGKTIDSGRNPSRIAMSVPSNTDSHSAASDVRKSGGASLVNARLRKHADYQRVYAAARKRRSASMSWFLARQPETNQGPGGAEAAQARVGLTVGKVLGKAHDRNRIKRRLREVLRRHLGELPQGCDLILHPGRTVLTMEFSKLDAEIVRILQQANADCARAREVDGSGAAKAEAVR
jgi:ribonuclease P protein component